MRRQWRLAYERITRNSKKKNKKIVRWKREIMAIESNLATLYSIFWYIVVCCLLFFFHWITDTVLPSSFCSISFRFAHKWIDHFLLSMDFDVDFVQKLVLRCHRATLSCRFSSYRQLKSKAKPKKERLNETSDSWSIEKQNV